MWYGFYGGAVLNDEANFDAKVAELVSERFPDDAPSKLSIYLPLNYSGNPG